MGNPDADMAATIQIFTTCARLIATIPAMPTDPNRPEDVRKTDADREGHGGDDAYDGATYGLMEASRPPDITWTPAALSGLARKSKV